jgi:hypothetical protein
VTRNQIAELRALERGAAVAPWLPYSRKDGKVARIRAAGRVLLVAAPDNYQADADVLVATVARNALPDLLSEREAVLDRLHAVAWKVAIAAADDRGNLLPPSMLGEYWRRQLVSDLADILTLLGGDHGDYGKAGAIQETQGAGQAQKGAPA